MDNTSSNELNKLVDQCTRLNILVNDGVRWADQYLKDEEKRKVGYDLKKYRRSVKRIAPVIESKPVIALFGASQVGKSYLVKNILGNAKSDLLIADHSQSEVRTIDFIKEINPEGHGSESTSIVTRFTYDQNLNPTLPPVKIKLLTPKDVIIILVDSYISDIKKRKTDARFPKEVIVQELDLLNDLLINHSQSFLDEDDIYDIEDYINDHFKDSNYRERIGALADARYWHHVALKIHKIDPQNWHKVFGILWGKDENLSELFRKLMTRLESIGFRKLVWSNFDAVRRDHGGILDVKRLHELYDPAQTIKIIIYDESKLEYSLDRNELCALSAEVILNIDKGSVDKNPFIEEVDILDFPGARTRLQLDENDGLKPGNIAEMLLRGKVSYLFNSYSYNFEIDNLFVCTHSKQSNVRILPELINNWIGYAIGDTPEKRTRLLGNSQLSPLFIIFTWWNTQLEYDQDNDPKEDFSYKWKLRFETLFREEILGDSKWWSQWTQEGSFKNHFLLRDFKYSKDVFDGFEEVYEEKRLHPHREAYYGKLALSFQQSPLVKKFFDDPVRIWNETSERNQDGSKYIIQRLEAVKNNRVRTDRFYGLLSDAHHEVLSILERHYHSDKSEERIIKASEVGSDVQLVMHHIFGGEAYHFGNFIEHLTITEKDIFDFYHGLLGDIIIVEKQSTTPYVFYRESSPGLSASKTFEENIEVLRQDYNKKSASEIIEFFKEKGLDLDQLFYGHRNDLKNASLVLAEQARDYWFRNNLNADKLEFFVEQGFQRQLLERLLENMKTTFNRLGLTRKIAEYIRSFVDRLNRIDDAEDMIAHITAGIINEFVTSVGWAYEADAEKEKIRHTNQLNGLRLVIPEDDAVFQSLDLVDDPDSGNMSLEKLIDYMENLNDILNEVTLNESAVRNVPMMKNYRRWRELMKISFIANCDIPTYDVQANAALGEVLDRLRVHA